jgi:tRNA (guanine26-N2/guanine27-N2)-dimethyltransferase
LNQVRTQEIKDSYKTHPRIEALLQSIISESVLEDVPLNYDLANVASHVKTPCPKKQEIYTAFKSLGHEITQTYYDPKLFKTTAPPEVIYDVFKAFKKKLSEKDEKFYLNGVKERSLSMNILQRDIEHKPNFDKEVVNADSVNPTGKGVKHKYYKIEEANWGPRPRATGKR